jgi:hypothetical protein
MRLAVPAPNLVHGLIAGTGRFRFPPTKECAIALHSRLLIHLRWADSAGPEGIARAA